MSSEQDRLLALFDALTPPERDSLLAYAEFLQTRRRSTGVPMAPGILPAPPSVERAKPLDIPRPSQEAVVAALKRLTATYPMLDKSKLLSDTSGLVTQHIMQGRPQVEVIDELEAIFVRHYQRWNGESSQD